MINKTTEKSAFRIINEILPSRMKFAYLGVCISLAFVNLLEGIGVGLIIPLLEILNKGTDPQKHGLAVKNILLLFERFSIQPNATIFLCIIFFFIASRYALTLLQSRFVETTLHKTTQLLRNRAFSNLMEVNLEYYHHNKAAEISGYLGHESVKGTFLIRSIINLFSTIILAVCYVMILALFSFWAVIVILFVLLLSHLLIKGIISKTKRLGFEKSRFDNQLSAFSTEVFHNITLIKGFSLEEKIKSIFSGLNNKIKDNWVNLSFNRRLMEFLINMIQLTAVALLIFFLLEILHFSTGYALGVLFIIFRLVPFINQIQSCRNDISENFSGLKNIYELGLRENKPYQIAGEYVKDRFNHSIEFKGAYFGYQKEKDVLRSIDLIISKGETVGIIGATGSGKSTLIYLIPRFYDLTRGELLIDGRNIRELAIQSWRKQIGIITQESFIFNDSIRNNLLIVKPEATDIELKKTLELSHLEELLSDFPRSLLTMVGDRGQRLSGGQKQRLAIARVFLCNPEILILDEATSSLDNISEKLIQQSIDELKKERTVIIVAHRLSTIKNADRLIVLEDGCIVEQGSPEELLKRKGQYYKYLEH